MIIKTFAAYNIKARIVVQSLAQPSTAVQDPQPSYNQQFLMILIFFSYNFLNIINIIFYQYR